MKKAISISIGGIVFNIEEDAYSSLQQYLNRLHRIFDKSEGGDEIMEDIEIRISELFSQKIKSSAEAINQSHVTEVISILGQPEDYQTESDFDDEEKNHEQSTDFVKNKKLYRDADDKIIAGVCSGLAHYFGWDVTWVRLAFVVLMFFPPFVYLVYIILWIVIPKALTTSEKLHMRGKSVTIENIKKKVDQSFEEVKASIDKVSEKNGLSKLLDSLFEFIGHVFSLLMQFFGAIFKVLGKFFKVVFGLLFMLLFIILGASILFTLLSGFFTSDSIVINISSMGTSSIPLDLLETVFIHGTNSMTMLIIGSFLVFVPLLFTLFYLGAKLLFRYQTNIKGWGFMVFISILIGGVLLTIVGVRTGIAYSNQSEIVESFYSEGDNLSVSLFDDPYFSSNIKHYKTNFLDLLSLENDSIVLGYGISLDLQPTTEQEFKVEVEKSSGGMSKMDAIDNINRMNYRYEEDANHLRLSPNILIPAKDKFHGQEIEVTIYVPEGKTLSLGDNIHRIYFHDWRLCSDNYRYRNCDGAVFVNDHGRITALENKGEKVQEG